MMNSVLSKIFTVVPNPAPVAPPGIADKVETVLSWMKWGGLAAVVAGFIGVGVILAVENKGGQGGENLKRVMFVAIGAIIIGGSSAIAGVLV